MPIAAAATAARPPTIIFFMLDFPICCVVCVDDGGAEPHLVPLGVGASRARFGVLATVGNEWRLCQ
jgi:hypothetical protein